MRHFDGTTYSPEHDFYRLNTQLNRVFNVMKDGKWRTLEEIQGQSHDSLPAISARLRDFRKSRFGGFCVERQHKGCKSRGLYEYRLDVTA